MGEDVVVDLTQLRTFVAKFRSLNTKIPLATLRRCGHLIGDKYIELLLQPTATWNHKPKMTKLVRTSQSGVIVLVRVDDEPYIYVTLGTPGHFIKPVVAQRLAFSGGYKAKTSPGSLAAQGGGKFGPIIYSMGVYHPGIEAREFHLAAFEQIRSYALDIIRYELEKELMSLGAI